MMRKHAATGFTLVEVVLALGITVMLYTVTTQSFFRGSRSATLLEAASQLTRDLKDAQYLAMSGTIPTGGIIVDYSLRFESDRYIVYPGIVYDSSNVYNRVVKLEPTMRFTEINVPNQTVTFARASGDVRNFDGLSNRVVISETALGEAYGIVINEHGVVNFTKQ